MVSDCSKIGSNECLVGADSWSWFELEVNGIIPLARCGHSSLLINNSVILFYGGVDADNEMLVDIRCLDLRKWLHFLRPWNLANHNL